jgi:rubrerythrin
MRIYRCRICGETYLGTSAPARCPFCGADERYMVGPDAFSARENDVQLTEVERADLEHAIELERSNARFYAAMARLEGHEALASAYKRLSRVEAEHCSLFCKLADIAKPSDLGEPSDASSGDWCTDIAQSLEREQTASAFYAQAAARATNPRIAEVLKATSAVERDHIELDGVTAGMAGCSDA